MVGEFKDLSRIITMMQEIGTGQSGRVFYIIAKTVKPEGKVDAMNEKEKVG